MSFKIAIFGAKGFERLEFHLADSLENMGYKAKIFDFDDAYSIPRKIAFWSRRFNEQFAVASARSIAKKIIKWRAELVICTFKDIHPVFVEEIKKHAGNLKCIHINPDQMTTLQNQQIIAANFDAYFIKDPFMVTFFRDKAGLNAHLLSEAFNPRVHVRPNISKKKAEQESGIDVLTFGGLYPYRVRILEQLVDKGFKIKIIGQKRPYLGNKLSTYRDEKYIVGEEKSKLVYGAKIVFNNFHYAEVEGVNVKFFEINGIGGFQFCDYKDILHDYLPYNPEEMSFRSINESVDKIRNLLESSKEQYRHEIADVNYTHFGRHHTYEHRFNEVFNILKIGVN
ncbi:MAG: glycosyltransferase [Bacteroidota bacterium]